MAVGLLLFGLIMLLLAVIGTFTGKTYSRGGGVSFEPQNLSTIG